MTSFEIPTTPQAQTFSISLGGVPYIMTIRWNDVAQVWIIDIADQNDVPLVVGIPMVTGCDLIGPFAWLGIGGSLVATTDHSPDTPPSFSDLGSTGHLYFVTQ